MLMPPPLWPMMTTRGTTHNVTSFQAFKKIIIFAYTNISSQKKGSAGDEILSERVAQCRSISIKPIRIEGVVHKIAMASAANQSRLS